MIPRLTNVIIYMVAKLAARRIGQLALVLALALLFMLQALPGISPDRAAAFVSSEAKSAGASDASAAGNSTTDGWILKAREGCLDQVLQGLQELESLGLTKVKQSGDTILVKAQTDLPDFTELAGNLPGLDWMEPNSRVSAAAVPDDPNFADQWNLAKLRMPEAWDTVNAGDSSVVVAVVDSGIAFEDRAGFSRAPDLESVPFLSGYDFVDEDMYPDDLYWHGTFVTEIICSGWNNAFRAAGIASGCTIMPLRALDAKGEGTLYDVADAINYAVDNGARIINLSLNASKADAYSQLVKDALDYAESRGVLCVVAAGNHLEGKPTNVGFPASVPSAIAVSATDVNDNLASYSNYGPEVDLAAPGGDSNGLIAQESFASDQKPSSGFALKSSTGTSFSAAQVSGVAALMLSANPDLTAAELTSLLTATCTDIGAAGTDNYFGAGMVNAAKAVQAAGSRHWYFAEGSTREGFQEWLCLVNTSSAAASANITYFYADTWLDESTVVPAFTRLTVPVNSVIGDGWDVSVRIITASRDLLCERPMYFSYRGKWTGGSAGIGSPRRSQLWFFSEGYTGPGFEEWLCLANPGEQTANVTVDYIYKSSTSSASYSLPPFSRRTLSVNAEVGANREVSLRVESNQPIVAERPMYFLYGGNIDGGHNVLGATYTSNYWCFAEGTTRDGFDEYLTITNPGSRGTNVDVYYLLGPGQGDALKKAYTVAGSSRFTINVRDQVGSDKDVSCFVQADQPVVAERPMYFRYGSWSGGHDVVGSNYAFDQWIFCEGTTRTGFEEWLTLANPNTGSATVTIDYIPGYGQGSSLTRTYTVEGGTRKTIYVPGEVGREKDISARVSSTLPIVAERPMYFRYGTWDGGTDVLGYPND